MQSNEITLRIKYFPMALKQQISEYTAAFPETETLQSVFDSIVNENNIKRSEMYGMLLKTPDQPLGRWLTDMSSQLSSMASSLQSGELCVKIKLRPQKIITSDGSLKAILFDETQSVSQLITATAEKNTLESEFIEEFSLKIVSPDKQSTTWLNPDLTLIDQRIDEYETLYFEKRFFLHDRSLTVESPVALSLTYSQVRNRWVDGELSVNCTADDALHMAALQIIADKSGLTSNTKISLDTVKMDKILPEAYRSGKSLQKDLSKKLQSLSDVTHLQAKLLFVTRCQQSELYEVTLFPIKELSNGKESSMLLGVSKQGVFRVNSQSKSIISWTPFQRIRSWSSTPQRIVIEATCGVKILPKPVNIASEPLVGIVSTPTVAENIEQLISGYHKIFLRSNPQHLNQFPVEVKPATPETIETNDSSESDHQSSVDGSHVSGDSDTAVALAPAKSVDPGAMVQSAFEALKALEREMRISQPINSDSGDRKPKVQRESIGSSSSVVNNNNNNNDSSDSDDDSCGGSDYESVSCSNNKELRLARKLTKMQAELQTLRLERKILLAKIKAAKVGKYSSLLTDIEQRIAELSLPPPPPPANETKTEATEEVLDNDTATVEEVPKSDVATAEEVPNSDAATAEEANSNTVAEEAPNGDTVAAEETNSNTVVAEEVPNNDTVATEETNSNTVAEGAPNSDAVIAEEVPNGETVATEETNSDAAAEEVTNSNTTAAKGVTNSDTAAIIELMKVQLENMKVLEDSLRLREARLKQQSVE